MTDKRPLIIVLLVIYLIISHSSIIPPTTPITKAVVIYESTLGEGADFGVKEVLIGRAATELRKLDKWRQYDKDHVPDVYVKLKDEALSNQKTTKRVEPWLFLFHDDKVTWKGPLPANDRLLKQLIESQGGM